MCLTSTKSTRVLLNNIIASVFSWIFKRLLIVLTTEDSWKNSGTIILLLLQLNSSSPTSKIGSSSKGENRYTCRKVNTGVPQGSILGPVLYLIYVNDLAEAAPGAELTLYADDTTFTVHAADEEEMLKASQIKDTLERWFEMNKLTVSQEKTKSMCITKARHMPSEVNNFKLLGITVDCKLNWKAHCEELGRKIAKNGFLLRRMKEFLSKEALIEIYHSMVHSHIKYGIMAWGHAPAAKLVFKAQRKIIRIVGNLPYRADCKHLFKELGILTLPSVFIMECLIYAHKDQQLYPKNCDLHNHDTRQKKNLHLTYCRTKSENTGTKFWAIRLYNKLPNKLKELPLNIFKSTVHNILIENVYYNLEDFLELKL